jgi:fluoroquinolone transport system permease protein
MAQWLKVSLWQLKLLLKYQIITIASVITIFYISLMIFLPVLQMKEISTVIIFSDPSMIGFIFIGVIILFEKSENTISGQLVTPMKIDLFIWSKALALLVPALLMSTGIACVAWKTELQILPFLLTVSILSLMFTFLGIVGVSRVKSFNQYILIIPLFLFPSILPLLNFYQLTDWKFLFIIPTQSALVLFMESCSPGFSFTSVFHFIWLILSMIISYNWAYYSVKKYLIQ